MKKLIYLLLLRPSAALSYAAGYDPVSNTLTLVSYSGPEPDKAYVNSVWGEQADPLKGDVINAYNDGPVEGTVMGPFYEIETSSRAALLEPGDSITHVQSVYHFTGSDVVLNKIANTLLNLSIDEMKDSFSE
jgi:hypothetical protein